MSSKIWTSVKIKDVTHG